MPRPPRRRSRSDGRLIQRTVLHRPILSITARAPSTHTIVAGELIARQGLINRVAAPIIRIIIQVSRVRVLPPPHCRFAVIRIGFLTRTDASVVDALEGGGAIGEGEEGERIEVDDGGAGAAGTLAADCVVLAVGGGYVAGILGGEEAAVSGRLGVAGGDLGDLGLACEIGG